MNPIPGSIPSVTALQTNAFAPAGVERPNLMPGAGGVSATSFGDLISNFVSDVDTKMKVSADERTKVLSGETSNLHQAMIASQESSVAFSLMVELRNKLVESYQELMRSQI